MRMPVIVFLLTLFISFQTLAGTTGIIAVEGTLISFDKTKVQIDTGAQKVYVPRNSFKSMDGYIAGKAFVSTKVSLSEFVKLNKKN